jgi:hypothetical protein
LEAKTAHKLGAIVSALPAFWNEYNVGVGTTAGMNAASAVKDGIMSRIKAEAERQVLEQQEAKRQAAQNIKEKAAEEQAARADQRNQDGAAQKAKVHPKMTAEERVAAEAVDVREFTQENYLDPEDSEVSGLFAQTKQTEAEVAKAFLPKSTRMAESSTVHNNRIMSVSPTDHYTDFQRTKHDVETFANRTLGAISAHIPQRVKDAGSEVEVIFSDLKARHDSAWEAFKKEPNLHNWEQVNGSMLALGGLAEGLEIAGDIVDVAKSIGRKGLRFMGTDPKTAQDIMSFAEGATYIFQPLKAGAIKTERAVVRGAAKLSRTADHAGRVTHDFMQRAAALNHPQPAFVKANSGVPQAFMVGYKPATKPMPLLSSMKAHRTGGIVSRESAVRETVSATPVAKSTARPQPAGQAESASGVALKYENAPYHKKTNNPVKNKAPHPDKAQAQLESSIQIKPSGPRRVAVTEDGEIVIFSKTIERPDGTIVYHGHVLESYAEASQDIKTALQKAKFFKENGKFIKGSIMETSARL